MSETNDTPREIPWSDVSWEDLETWAGSRSLHRGRAYHKGGHVLELACSPEWELSGRVEGTEVYTTTVLRFATGVLWSRCSCPVGANCKHAVAVVLEYLDRLQTGEEVLTELTCQAAPGVLPEADVGEYLEGLSATELLALIHELAECSEEARTFLDTRARLASGDLESIVGAARAELWRATAEPGWRNYWTGEGHTPDYDLLTTYLRNLLSLGKADMVLDLGRELLEAGQEQVGLSDDEGETAMAIADALEPVWQALGNSSLSPAERIVWMYDRYEEDEYDLCDGSIDVDIWEVEPEVWSDVADVLVARLDAMGPYEEDGRGGWHRDYKRARAAGLAINALQSAKRTDEAITLAIREAKVTRSYDRAVDLLIEEGRPDEARSLAIEGIERLGSDLPGISAHLRDRLRTLASRLGDQALAAAIAAEEFFLRPSLEAYRQLRETAERAEVWEEVRAKTLACVQKNKVPFGRKGWPLPDTGTWRQAEEPVAQTSPRCLLTRIALDESDHAEALKWYGKRPADPFVRSDISLAEQVARGVAATHPDESVAIWRALAEEQIAYVNRAAYEASLRYLWPMRRLLVEAGRQEEWDAYLAQVRENYSNRPALLETLDSLTDGPIIAP